jgi:FemAB-related protein (PEP-CTERM system-associated)
MDIKRFNDSDRERWDHFVNAHPAGTFFHRIGWKNILEQTFDFHPAYLYAEEKGEIRGIFPLFPIKGLFAPRCLISTPFAVYGGILVENDLAKKLLLESARAVAQNERADYIELKSIRPGFDHLPIKDLYVTFLQTLHADPEENLNLIPRKTRRMVRVGIKTGLETEITRDEIETFYDIYARSLKNLGTPVFPKQLFVNIRKELPEESFILYVRYQGKRVAGVLTFIYKDCLMPYYGGSDREYNHLAVNNFMYWKLMEYGCLNGFKTFDFGRSKKWGGSGSYEFKRHWGMEEINLAYQYDLLKGSELPNISPTNAKFKLFINTWKKLPLAVTKVIGPRLVKYFP